MKLANIIGIVAIATLMTAGTSAHARDGLRPARAAQPHTRTTERQRTENGRLRNDTWTNAGGAQATRDLQVSRDKENGTVTRTSDYTTFNGGEGSKTDVIQRTDDGFARDVTRTLPDGRTHTRSVDVSCNKDAGKCVKQVEVDQKP